jgi:triacylglycerol lipase
MREQKSETVVCIHGLGRTAWSMWRPAFAAWLEGYRILPFSYRSRSATCADHAAKLAVFIHENGIRKDDTVHFITHSLGGLVLAEYLNRKDAVKSGRIVMIAPPHGGSPIIDEGMKWPGFKEIIGPVTSSLTTKNVESIATVHHNDIAVIAGNKGQWPWSQLFIGEPNDGKVSVASTKAIQSKEHITLPYNHTEIIFRSDVMERALRFIKTGSMSA